MLRDFGSREPDFVDLVREIRAELLEIGGVRKTTGFEAVLMQGSGTFGVESVVGSVIPREGKLLTVVNGAYGRRIDEMARRLGIDAASLVFEDTEMVDPALIKDRLEGDPAITHVAVVHCETTTGILNPLEEIARIVAGSGRVLIVDAMSSFGGIPIDLNRTDVGFLVSSANKCLEGVPGFSFILARRDLLEAARGNARSLSLDLAAQWDGLEGSGQFPFTPPTHALLAFRQALAELREEGGVDGRHRRYCENCDILICGMEAHGFECLLEETKRSPILTTFVEPDHSGFRFDAFYDRLAARELIIYPGKLSRAASFRIGTIGRIGAKDVSRLLNAIGETLEEMDVDLAGGR